MTWGPFACCFSDVIVTCLEVHVIGKSLERAMAMGTWDATWWPLAFMTEASSPQGSLQAGQ